MFVDPEFKPSITINVAKDFSKAPGPRYRKDGAHSAEEFREEHLLPKLKQAIEQKCKLIVQLDGTFGYADSFLNEAFAGLIRIHGYTYLDIMNVLVLESNEDKYICWSIKDDLKSEYEYHYIQKK